MKKIYTILLFLMFALNIFGQTTYTWNVASGSWTSPTSWSPIRNTPASNDILIFDGNVQINSIINNLPATESFGQLIFKNNVTTDFSAPVASSLTITGGESEDFDIQTGSTCKLTGEYSISINLAMATTGIINGTFRCPGVSTLAVSHKLLPIDPSSLIVYGTIIQGDATGNKFTGNLFGSTGGTNVVIFKSGSKFYQRQGSNPFAINSPNSRVIFESGSSYYYYLGGAPSVSGRTYANLIFGNSQAPACTTAVNSDCIIENLTIESGNSLNWNSTGTGKILISKNLTQSSSYSNIIIGAGGGIFFNGSGDQIIGGNGSKNLTITSAININSTSNVILNRNLVVNNSMIVNGTLTLNDKVISGTGSFLLSPNSTLKIGHSSGFNGNVTLTGSIDLGTSCNFEFNGLTPQVIGSILPGAYKNLTINNSNNVTLSGNITVNGNLSVSNGDLDLNGKTLTLGSTASLIETPGNTIKGSTGKIVTTRTFNAGDLSAGVNVAGLGAKITTDQALGETIIERSHSSSLIGNRNTINRIYKINPTNNSGLNANLEFSYDESEIGSINENDLGLFKSETGSNDSWNFVGGATDVTNNKVLVNNVNDFSFWTLFESNLTPYTVPMSASVNNADAFGTKGSIGADQWTSYFAHWDNNYLYLGWNGGKTNYSSDMYYAAIDIDPDGNNGCVNPIEGVSFKDGGPKPDFYVVYENNSSFYGAPTSNGNAIEIYNGSSGTWNWVNRTDGNDNTSSKVVFSDNAGEVRLRIPWSTLGITPGASTKLGLVMWNNNGSGNWLWGRVPLQNPNHGSSVILDYQFIYSSTGAGVNPSTDFVSTPLPVELSSFNASAKGNNVQLNWKTATEKDNYGFDVERSVNNVWEKVGFVQGSGNSNSVKEYSFVDNSVREGKYSYRLKQVDNSGKYTYSNVVEVEISIPNEYSLTQNYPNPFNPSTTISYKLPMQSKVQLNVYNISGELVSSLVNEEQSAGSYNINFDASKLATGTYIYRLIANDFVMTKKMLLIK